MLPFSYHQLPLPTWLFLSNTVHLATGFLRRVVQMLSTIFGKLPLVYWLAVINIGDYNGLVVGIRLQD